MERIKHIIDITYIFICIFTTTHFVQMTQLINIIRGRNMFDCVHQKSPNLRPSDNKHTSFAAATFAFNNANKTKAAETDI